MRMKWAAGWRSTSGVVCRLGLNFAKQMGSCISINVCNKLRTNSIPLNSVHSVFQSISALWFYGIITFFNSGCTVAAKKHHLSYKTPQSGLVTMAFRPSHWNALGVKRGKQGKKWSDFDPQRTRSSFLGCKLQIEVSSKLSENYNCRRGHRHTDASDFIICPHATWCSNQTDNNT